LIESYRVINNNVVQVQVMVSLAKLPAFLLAVYLMYWSLPLANLFFYIKSWKLIGKRNDIYQWWAAPPPSGRE
jgi:uncharacterized membrane-anchored protein YitT (DUF2179 family)